MKLKLAEWASIADVVSGIAVVVTLIFLIAGIRENTQATRAAAFESNMSGLSELRALIIGDSEIAEGYEAFRNGDFDSLDDGLRTRIRQLIWFQLGIYENAFYARRYEVLGEDEWSRFVVQVCRSYPRITASHELTELLSLVLTVDFFEFITTECDEPLQ